MIQVLKLVGRKPNHPATYVELAPKYEFLRAAKGPDIFSEDFLLFEVELYFTQLIKLKDTTGEQLQNFLCKDTGHGTLLSLRQLGETASKHRAPLVEHGVKVMLQLEGVATKAEETQVSTPQLAKEEPSIMTMWLSKAVAETESFDSDLAEDIKAFAVLRWAAHHMTNLPFILNGEDADTTFTDAMCGCCMTNVQKVGAVLEAAQTTLKKPGCTSLLRLVHIYHRGSQLMNKAFAWMLLASRIDVLNKATSGFIAKMSEQHSDMCAPDLADWPTGPMLELAEELNAEFAAQSSIHKVDLAKTRNIDPLHLMDAITDCLRGADSRGRIIVPGKEHAAQQARVALRRRACAIFIESLENSEPDFSDQIDLFAPKEDARRKMFDSQGAQLSKLTNDIETISKLFPNPEANMGTVFTQFDGNNHTIFVMLRVRQIVAKLRKVFCSFAKFHMLERILAQMDHWKPCIKDVAHGLTLLRDVCKAASDPQAKDLSEQCRLMETQRLFLPEYANKMKRAVDTFPTTITGCGRLVEQTLSAMADQTSGFPARLQLWVEGLSEELNLPALKEVEPGKRLETLLARLPSKVHVEKLGPTFEVIEILRDMLIVPFSLQAAKPVCLEATDTLTMLKKM